MALSPLVFEQLAILAEPGSACIALEGFLSSVDSQMVLDVVFLRKLHVTFIKTTKVDRVQTQSVFVEELPSEVEAVVQRLFSD